VEFSAAKPTDQDMRISLFAVGRLKTGPEKELASRYLDRFAKAGPAVGLELSKQIEIQESRASNADARKREEAGALEKVLPDGAVLVLLDERGKALDRSGLAPTGRHGAQPRLDDLAASAGAHSDCRTALPRRHHSFGPSLSQGLNDRLPSNTMLFVASPGKSA
jgi:hypothetical protein